MKLVQMIKAYVRDLNGQQTLHLKWKKISKGGFSYVSVERRLESENFG
jgi:hypothetical protein